MAAQQVQGFALHASVCNAAVSKKEGNNLPRFRPVASMRLLKAFFGCRLVFVEVLADKVALETKKLLQRLLCKTSV